MVIYFAYISHMQTNAEYVTTVTRMSVYYIQYEKNNKCICYKTGWYRKMWESVQIASTSLYLSVCYVKKQWTSLCE